MQKIGKILTAVGILMVWISLLICLIGKNADVMVLSNFMYAGMMVEVVGVCLKKPKYERKSLLCGLTLIILNIGIIFWVKNKIG